MLYCFTDHVQTATRVAAYQRVLCTVALLYLTLISLMVNDLGWPSGSCSAVLSCRSAPVFGGGGQTGGQTGGHAPASGCSSEQLRLQLCLWPWVGVRGLEVWVLNVLVRSWWRLAVITCHRRWAVRWLQLTFALQVFLKLRSAAEVLTCTLFYIFCLSQHVCHIDHCVC